MSFAGFFPPAEVLGSSWFDGSAVWDVDIFSAINRCVDKGFAQSDITVDIIMTSAANLKNVSAEDYKSIGMLFRYLEISSFYNTMDGYLRAKFAYKDVDFRYVVTPSGSIPSSLYPLVSYSTSLSYISVEPRREANPVCLRYGQEGRPGCHRQRTKDHLR